MRLERRDDGKGELNLRAGTAHVLKPEKLARLAVWIEELWPEEVAQERKPKAPSLIRDDGDMHG